MGFSPLTPGRKFPFDIRPDRQVNPKIVKNSSVFPPWGLPEFPSRVAYGTAAPMVALKDFNPLKSLQMSGLVRPLRLFFGRLIRVIVIWALPARVRKAPVIGCGARAGTNNHCEPILALTLRTRHSTGSGTLSRGDPRSLTTSQACRCAVPETASVCAAET